MSNLLAIIQTISTFNRFYCISKQNKITKITMLKFLSLEKSRSTCLAANRRRCLSGRGCGCQRCKKRLFRVRKKRHALTLRFGRFGRARALAVGFAECVGRRVVESAAGRVGQTLVVGFGARLGERAFSRFGQRVGLTLVVGVGRRVGLTHHLVPIGLIHGQGAGQSLRGSEVTRGRTGRG